MPRPSSVMPPIASVAIVIVVAGTVVPVAAPAPPAAAETPVGHVAGAPGGIPLGPGSGGPAGLVDPEAGTGIGPAAPGNVSEYPGASVPLGMVQFSPDTSPHRAVTTGSGYDYSDSEISGFSLTHLSGPGCAIYGDIPILPVQGSIPVHPDNAAQPFSHRHEKAAAGHYHVGLGLRQEISADLTATTRTAFGRFAFGPGATGSPGFLVKVTDSANGSSAAQTTIVGSDEVTGSVTSGDFCGIPGNYTLYFVARFSRAFSRSGTWVNDVLDSRRSCAATGGSTCGDWVSFAPPGGTVRPTIDVKVGISFVSLAGAASNLADEDPGWSFADISRSATAEWNGLLGRVAVEGGTTTARRTFYTALYHSLLFPSVFSDDDGQYIGFDHRIHTLPPGQVQYSNISENDIYRSEVPLLAMLLPRPTSQMVQSLLNDAAQTKGGFLPKWVIADNDAGQWDGDSVDPFIADAYAFGARRFNLRLALRDVIHGATVSESGLVQERANLAAYEAQGWVPQLTYDITSYPYTDGGSETLEYSIDDFAISQLARAAGDDAAAAAFARRGQNWQNLFDPSTGYLAARQADGSFPAGAAFQPASPADQAQGIAQSGFEEGNAIQYTWDVPQNLAGLFALMGGDGAARAKLDTFFTHLNATRFQPYDWAGNEPSQWTPFEYDYAGAPWQTQSVVRRIVKRLYPLAPAAEPGEDDLGALSSWYVWAALGLFPETPGAADMAVSSPLFPHVTITEGGGQRIVIAGDHAPDQYIAGASLAIGSAAAKKWNKPWIPAAAVAHGATVTFDLRNTPDESWGASASDAPPSFPLGSAPAVAFTTPGGTLALPLDTATTVRLGVQEGTPVPPPGDSSVVTWDAVSPPPTEGVTVAPNSGTVVVTDGRATTPVQISATTPGTYALTFDLRQATVALPPVTLDVVVTP
jgi:predicted alpha-1,2-mannosidase